MISSKVPFLFNILPQKIVIDKYSHLIPGSPTFEWHTHYLSARCHTHPSARCLCKNITCIVISLNCYGSLLYYILKLLNSPYILPCLKRYTDVNKENILHWSSLYLLPAWTCTTDLLPSPLQLSQAKLNCAEPSNLWPCFEVGLKCAVALRCRWLIPNLRDL